ncbi:hypothetical protein EBZ39_06975 [bacterium]|nr:hypothetical protein [bacterium]
MPAGAALGVFPLAAEFGWSTDYILWELPLVLLYQAHSWILWKNGLRLRRTRRGHVSRADIAKKLGI